jgi:hypothetical protein
MAAVHKHVNHVAGTVLRAVSVIDLDLVLMVDRMRCARSGRECGVDNAAARNAVVVAEFPSDGLRDEVVECPARAAAATAIIGNVPENPTHFPRIGRGPKLLRGFQLRFDIEISTDARSPCNIDESQRCRRYQNRPPPTAAFVQSIGYDSRTPAAGELSDPRAERIGVVLTGARGIVTAPISVNEKSSEFPVNVPVPAKAGAPKVSITINGPLASSFFTLDPFFEPRCGFNDPQTFPLKIEAFASSFTYMFSNVSAPLSSSENS